MSGRRIMVIGSCGGIGKSCAEKLDKLGYRLVVTGTDEEKIKSVIDHLNNVDMYMKMDVTDTNQVKQIFDCLKEKKLKLDGMIYASGISGVQPLKVINRELLHNVFEVNCFGFMDVCKYMASKRISNDFSSIVAISSMASVENYIGEIAYCASKAALNSAVKVASKELMNRKIRVNAVLPGTTETPMINQAREFDTGFDENVLRNQPLGIIQPEYVADMVEFLLSDKSRFITGDCIMINAGREC